MFATWMPYLIVFLPLIGAAVAGFAGKRLGDRGAQLLTSGFMVVSAVLSCLVLSAFWLGDAPATVLPIFTWIDSGAFSVAWSLRVDALTAVMLVVVTVVSSIVHIYSAGYMSEDKSIPRFQAYLSLFTFTMLMLVTADNLVQLFFGWEGVGLSSYLLIGFWYHKQSANAAAMKAFIVNRVGDFGFALGIFGLFYLSGSVVFGGEAGLFAFFEQYNPAKDAGLFGFSGQTTLNILLFLLFMGAMGKSAQLFLHTWLPDAMEGPTPVSALIHAATMVTAGVFMVARLSPVFELAPLVLNFMTIIGACTALFAATVGLTQFDIKRVIAYSTCSQLGYMFFAEGVGAYNAAIFHLMTHASFKALLFLGAGSVIHAMHHEQDMRKMGGIWRKVPVTYAYFWIGTLAIAGIGLPISIGIDGGIGFAGFYSKDAILEAAKAAGTFVGDFAFWIGVVAAFLTAFYSGRLLFLTFHGETRADQHTFDHAHESPFVMIGPMAILAVGGVVLGAIAYPVFFGKYDDIITNFWDGAIYENLKLVHAAHDVDAWVKWLPLVMGVGGLGLSWVFYVAAPSLPVTVSKIFWPLDNLFRNKWYFDELYHAMFVVPAQALGRLFWKGGDGRIIDGLGPDGIAELVRRASVRLSALQTGFLYHYAFAMLLGVFVLVLWFLVRSSGG